jgi:hypothetical protein
MEMNENIQMIIVSQNLEFVRRMEKYTSCYYDVSLDEQSCSIITRKDIREINEDKQGKM